MYKFLTFVSTACLLVLLGPQCFAAEEAPSVSLYISEPRGGYGDTAASLLMIERLAESFRSTGTEFSVVYPELAKEQVHALWPDFNPDLDVQFVRGILFSSVERAQQADIGLTFSANLAVPKNIAKVGILYFEYEQMDIFDDTGIQTSKRHYRLTQSPITSANLSDISINTGFSNGVYVMDGFRPEDFDKSLTFKFLRKFSPTAQFSDSANLGYAYASSPALVQQYVNAMEKFNQNKNNEIVIVTNHSVETKDQRIRIINMKGLPFNLNQKLIKSSDVPILVTGDGSLSLAIEGRKPFFYSLYSWKRFTPDALRRAIEKASPALRKDRNSMDLIATLLRLDTTGNRSYEDLFLRVMENPSLQAELTRVYDTFVKTDSLVSLVQKDIQMVKSLKSDFSHSVYGKFVNIFWQLSRKSKDQNQAIQKVEKLVFDVKRPARERISYLLSLKTLNNYSEQRFADLFSKVITDGDVELRSAMSFVIHDAYSTFDFVKLHSLLTASAQKEFILIMKNLADQDPNQWGPYANGAKRVLPQLEAQANSKNHVFCKEFYK